MTCLEKLRKLNPLFDERVVEDVIRSYCPFEWGLTILPKDVVVMVVVRNVGIMRRLWRIDILKKFIVYLIRKRLGLKTYETFQFVGQKSNAVYYFTEDAVMKIWYGVTEKSGVSLNWLLDNECEIRKVDGVEVER